MKKLLIIFIGLACFSLASAQEKVVTGIVKDNSGGLPGASVLIKGTTDGTDTDFDGKYSIKTRLGDVLVFSYVGYKTVEKIVESSSIIDVTMEAGAVLDEIVVVAYGTSRKASYTGSVTLVRTHSKSRKERAKHQVLHGEMNGILLNSLNGQPGVSSQVIMRGASSLKGNKKPLFIVDGVVVSKREFKKLDYKSINSLSVLKDEQATALYGSRGVNGVVIINTKNGRNDLNNESYNEIVENQYKSVESSPLSTFSIDVDKASYSNIRRMINNGQKVSNDAVKIEEMVNYFSYNYPQPKDEHPFSINTEIVKTPWNQKTRLVRIGLQGKTYIQDDLPASNLTFLLDVSGSMDSPNKLGLVKSCFRLLVNQLRKKDKVSIVVYAGAAGVVLEPTSGDKKEKILNALNKLEAGGSTAGGEGIKLAYKLAQENFKKRGNNRVIIATDGDFNVGASSDEAMEKLITEKRKSDVFLSVLGFGMGNYKDSKLETLADKGNGNHAYIDNMQEAQKVFGKEFGGTLYTIAKDVKIQIEFNPQNVAAYRLIGYENRLLNDEDFVDDTIDAGELGSGHTVTALYEILPIGITSDLVQQPIDLKYTNTSINQYKDELFTVKFRYKKPREDTSIEMTRVVKNEIQEASVDMNFASAIALFGMQLRGSKFHNKSKINDVIALAKKGKGSDVDGYRSEFIRLVKLY
tara:strand:- start:26064 stop:28136 length:2073 start_codon:yes stop_codon:yes gene_type:complete